VNVQDEDDVQVTWEFDGGRGGATGTAAQWSFAIPGQRAVRVIATDSDGATSSLEWSLPINETPDAPYFEPIERRTILQDQVWSTIVRAIDTDRQDRHKYSLSNAPDGMSIDASTGRIQWTPTREQSGKSYDLEVHAIDQFGLTASTPMTLDVQRLGLISGYVFEDRDRNGTRGETEQGIENVIVELVMLPSMTVSGRTETNLEGNYSFDRLVNGAYEVRVIVRSFVEVTSPSIQSYVIAVGEALEGIPIGLSLDSDEDGVSNEIERSSNPDGNSDGIADWLQSHVATLVGPTGLVRTVVAPSRSMIRNATLTALPPASPDYLAPELGLMRFELHNLPKGGEAIVDILWQNMIRIEGVYKYGPVGPNETDRWFALPSSGDAAWAKIQDDRVRLRLIDGVLGDLDWNRNGVIVDPVAFSVDAVVQNDSWHNQELPWDVDFDGTVSPLDVLTLINRINQGGDGPLPALRPEDEPFLDVDNDLSLSPLDVLAVINRLNQK
jgi:hypothetical protein